MKNDPMVEAAVRGAMQGQIGRPPQQQGLGITVPELMGLVDRKVLTPRQLYGMLFEGKHPEKYEGEE